VRILHLISSGGFYGAESVLLGLAESLNRLGCQNVIGVFQNTHRPNTDFLQAVKQRGIETEEILCNRRLDTAAVRTIRRIVRDRKIDVVNAHGYKADIYAWAAGRSLTTPLVATVHSWESRNTRLSLYATLDHFLLRRFDAAVAVSAPIAAAIRRSGMSSDRVRTITNGVNLQPFRNARSGLPGVGGTNQTKVIGFVGRLVPLKGIDYLLYAFQKVLTHDPDVRLVIVGQGPLRTQFEKLAQDLHVAQCVDFLGERRDMPAIYASLDVFVLPSLTEGMPMTVLESLAAATAVVATPVGSIPEVIRHEETGLLVQPKDVDGLANSLLRLLRDPDLRGRLATNGAAVVENLFSAENMARKYKVLYESASEFRLSPRTKVAIQDAEQR
jgi:glycosyltransferase involved in cell wall biosynthesis